MSKVEAVFQGETTNLSKNEMDESDALTTLTAWVGENLYELDNKVITFGKLDAELRLPPGSSAKHRQKIAEEQGAKTVRRGTATILFESPGTGFSISV